MITIRPMTEDDLPALAGMYVKSFADPALGEHWTEPTAQALLVNWYNRQPDLAFVATDDSKLLGAFVVGVRPWWDGNHLVDGELFVDSDSQGKGVASDLIRKVLLQAKAKYAPVVWESYTFKGQDFPLNWYKRMGFREIDEWVMIRADVADVLNKLDT